MRPVLLAVGLACLRLRPAPHLQRGGAWGPKAEPWRSHRAVNGPGRPGLRPLSGLRPAPPLRGPLQPWRPRRARCKPASACITGPDVDIDVYGRRVLEAKLDGSSNEANDEPTQSVLKVYCVHSSQDPTSPWGNKPQEESTGSAVYVEYQGEQLILTNAHVVSDATYVELRKAGDACKYTATRVKISHECDLAILRVEDQNFLEGMQPLHFGSMPSLQDEVSVVGYPEGGEGVAITQGVVSRIGIQSYAHSGASLLAVQIDAAINPGNSGGPALDEMGNIIGVAFQNQESSQNIGYVIPIPTIQHFLKDTDPSDPSRCAGFCSLGIFWQELENCQLRKYLRIPSNCSGVLVRSTVPLSPASRLLHCGDVIMAVDARRIANDATFAVGKQERLSFQHLIQTRFPNETIELRLLREGAEVTVAVPVQPLPRLVPSTIYDEPQSYFIYGGLAFLALTLPYLQDWGDDWRSTVPTDFMELAFSGMKSQPDEEVVVFSRCFPSERTAGYSALAERRVLKLNGVKVVNLWQMYCELQRLRKMEEPFIVLELQSTGSTALLSIDTSSADEVCHEVLTTYRIPAHASRDLLEACNHSS